jgi:ribosomal-protein-alanine N-acetyltransferase
MDELETIKIDTSRLRLTPVLEEDCSEEYLSWLNDEEVNLYLESGLQRHTMKELLDFVKGYQVNRNAVFLAIRIAESNLHIGNIKLDKINYVHLTCEYGIMMGKKDQWGKGYAKEASHAIIDYAFHRLGMRKVNLGVIDANIAAVRLYEQMGFEVEGILKENFYDRKDGCFRNELRMALFRNTWKNGE